MTTYLDGGRYAHDWVNSLTAALVGPGNPLQLGATYRQREGAATECYALMVELPASLWAGHENPDMAQRISWQVYGPTKEATALAARALAEAHLPPHQGHAVDLGGGVTLAAVDNITGPSWEPDGSYPRYILDADFHFTAG